MGIENINKSNQSQERNREHIFRGFMNSDGKTANTEFFSRDEHDNERSESSNLETDVSLEQGEERGMDKDPFPHDALHPLVQAKLDSIGVERVRVTSIENEMMVNAMIRVNEKLNKKFGGEGFESVKTFMVSNITNTYPDAKNNGEKYEEFAENLFKLYMQLSALSKNILNNEGDSFKSYIDTTQQALMDHENDVYGNHGEETSVRVGFASDPELTKIYESEVKIINNTLQKLQRIRVEKGIVDE